MRVGGRRRLRRAGSNLMCPVDASGTIAGIVALRTRLKLATRDIAAQGAAIVQRIGMDRTHVRSGSLRRSWRIVGPVGGDTTYSAAVGPTMIYARRQELGFLPPLTDSLGRQFPNDPGWPYVRPAHDEAVEPVYQKATEIVRGAVSGG